MQRAIGIGLIVAMSGIVTYAFSHRPPAPQPATVLKMQTSLVLDIAQLNNKLVSIGESGLSFVSSDKGATWSAINTGTQATLTKVNFLDSMTGLAVGHDAVILKTQDGGATWALKHNDPAAETPLLNIQFLSKDIAIAVGAYGLFLQSNDGGEHWDKRAITEEDKHFNGIIPLGNGRTLIVGEAGTLLSSEDQGEHWRKITSPYPGSFFGGIKLDDSKALVYGMRGHMYVLDTQDNSMTAIESGTEASLFGASRLDEQHLAVTGQDGTVLISQDNGQTFKRYITPGNKMHAALILEKDSVLAFGERGMTRLPITAQQP